MLFHIQVNMDRNSADYYVEAFEESVAETIKVIENVVARNNPLLVPIITPR